MEASRGRYVECCAAPLSHRFRPQHFDSDIVPCGVRMQLVQPHLEVHPPTDYNNISYFLDSANVLFAMLRHLCALSIIHVMRNLWFSEGGLYDFMEESEL